MDIKEEQMNKNNETRHDTRIGLLADSTDNTMFSNTLTTPFSDKSPECPQGEKDLSSLLAQTASLLAVNEQLRKEIAENEHIHSMQMRALHNHPASGGNHYSSHQQHMDSRRRGERRMQKPESYKTVICQAWLESKTCTFAENCRFAHGEEELRPSMIEPRPNNKYKTKLCDKYTTTGLCPYGKRCLFIHPDHGPNAYIRADKLYEVSQRHALADLRDQMENEIMNGGRAAPTPQPSDILGRPSTPVDQKISNVPLGPTPVSGRHPRYELPSRNAVDAPGSRPHPSWPLETNGFFSLENANMTSRPVSPFESMLIGNNANAGGMPFTVMGKQSTPVSGYASGGSTPYQDLDSSPFSPADAAAFLASSAASVAVAAPKPGLLAMPGVVESLMFSRNEESFSPMPGFDKLAEDMAKHLDLW